MTNDGALTFPRPLRKGDCVAVVSPASPPKPEPIERAFAQLRSFGLEVKTYGDIFRSRGYLAGDDDVRAEELMQALADREVAAVLPTRGGYGLTRIVQMLDYSVIAANPKTVIGFSDLTALHLAIAGKANRVTYHGPHLQDGIGAEEGFHPLAGAAYQWALFGVDADGKPADEFVVSDEQLAGHGLPPMTTLAPGLASGPVTGGNLSLVAASLGTPFEIETAGRILFLEDVNERLYRVDRKFSQLRLAGKLDHLAGVVLGYFTNCEPEAGKPSLTVDEIFTDHLGSLGVPVLTGFPAGHEQPNVAFPHGGVAHLDAGRHQVRFVRPAVSNG